MHGKKRLPIRVKLCPKELRVINFGTTQARSIGRYVLDIHIWGLKLCQGVFGISSNESRGLRMSVFAPSRILYSPE